MFVRSIRSSFSFCRFFYSSSLSENTLNTGNLNQSLSAKLFRLKDPSKAPIVIAKWKAGGRAVSSDDISSAVRGLINHRRYHQALAIWDSIVERKMVELKPLDYASHLGLIANARGLESAERYFKEIPKELKDEIVYSALLSIYVQRGAITEAEHLMEKMERRGFLTSAQPYIRMMSLYTSMGEIDKAEEMIEAVKRHIEPNFRAYNMWLNACASMNDVEGAGMVLSEMKAARVEPNWLTHGTLAGLYIRGKHFEKAASALKEMEEALVDGDRMAYCSLIRMYGSVGDRDGILRAWEKMKLKLCKMTDYDYNMLVKTLLGDGWYEKAEEVYSEWVAVRKDRGIQENEIYDFELLKDEIAGRDYSNVEARVDERSAPGRGFNHM